MGAGAGAGAEGVAFLTPVAASDVERCELLLDSLECVGSTFPHFLVVNTEHTPTVGARLKARAPRARVLSTADVLDARTERRRRPSSRKRPGYWLAGHWRDEPRIRAWCLQQLVKLAFANAEPAAAVVCVDTDLVALRPPRLEDFLTVDGIPLLVDGPTLDAEMASWEIRAMRFLDIPLQSTELRRHTYEPAILSSDAVRELVGHMGGPQRWVDVFVSQGLTEYALHGVWRRYRSAVPLSLTAPGTLAHSVRFPREVVNWREVLGDARRSGALFFHAHSGLQVPVGEMRAIVEVPQHRESPHADR